MYFLKKKDMSKNEPKLKSTYKIYDFLVKYLEFLTFSIIDK